MKKDTENLTPRYHLDGNARHNAKLDMISIRTDAGTKDRWKASAEAEGISLVQYIIKSVNEYEKAKSVRE